jgi:hypothetical protein
MKKKKSIFFERKNILENEITGKRNHKIGAGASRARGG